MKKPLSFIAYLLRFLGFHDKKQNRGLSVSKKHMLCLLLLLFFNNVAIVNASADTIVKNEVTINILSSGFSDDDSNENKIYGALHFKLKSGWKIYGNVAGDVGLPTQVSIDQKPSKNIENIEIIWPKAIKFNDAGFTSFGYENELFLPFQVKLQDNTKSASLTLDLSFGICKDICIPYSEKITINLDKNYFDQANHTLILSQIEKINRDLADHDNSQFSFKVILLMIVFAFLGGVILNIMPCVLPVLSIKILSIIKAGAKEKKDARYSLFAVAFGIIFSFLVLAIFTHLLKLFGQTVGWGIHFQEPIFILFLIIILILFVANLLDYLNIKLPDQLSSRLANRKKNKSNFVENFFTGSLATLLATPCSAPFLGTAVGFALSSSYIYIYAIFLMMGIGMAMPYFLIILFPSFLNKLPKPGFWMIKVKRFLALLLLFTIAWLIFVIWGQLSFVSAIITFLLAVMLLKAIKMHKNYNKSLIKKANLFSIGTMMIAILILPIFIGKFSKYRDEMSDNIWIEFNQNQIREFVKNDKIVFVNVTADWCVTCKYNELFILKSYSVGKELSSEGVVAMKADYTNRSDEIARYLESFNRYSIPFYVIYSKKYPNGLALPDAITKKKMLEYIQSAKKT